MLDAARRSTGGDPARLLTVSASVQAVPVGRAGRVTANRIPVLVRLTNPIVEAFAKSVSIAARLDRIWGLVWDLLDLSGTSFSSACSSVARSSGSPRRPGQPPHLPRGTRIAGSTPRWLGRAQSSAPRPAQRIGFGVLLGMRDQAGAVATLKAISEPASKSYGHWLSGAAFRASYAPARASSRRRAALAPLAGLHDHEDPAQRDVRGGQRIGGAGREDLRHEGRQLPLPGHDGAGQRDAAVPAGQHARGGQDRDRRGARDRPGLSAEAARRYRARAAAWRQVRGAAVLGLLRPEDGDRSAAGLRHSPAVRGLRVRAAAVPAGLRRDRPAAPRRGRPRGHGGDHRRLRVADDLRATPSSTAGCTTSQGSGAASSPRSPRPRTATTWSASAARRAGTARRPSTSRPCTRWHPAPGSCTSAPRTAPPAWTTPGPARSTITSPMSSPIRGPTAPTTSACSAPTTSPSTSSSPWRRR